MAMLSGEMYGDEGIWSYMGRVWIDKAITPYSKTLDDKPLGIIVVNALSYALFGVNFFFTRLIGMLCIILTSFLLYKINEEFFFPSSGIYAMITFNMVTVWGCTNGSITGFSEVFMVCFSTIGFYLIFRTLKLNETKTLSFIFIGLAFGIAISFKQVAALSLLIALFIYFYFKLQNKRAKIKRVALILFSSVFIFTIFHIPILSPNALANYINFAWLNPRYYETIFWRLPKFFDAFFNSRIVLFYPILMLLILFKNDMKNEPIFKFINLWLLSSFIGVNVSGYYSGHQLTQLLPPLALLAGISFGKVTQYFSLSIKRFSVLLIMLVLPYNVIIHNVASILSSQKLLPYAIINHINGNSRLKKLGFWIRERTEEGDYIYTYGKGLNVSLAYSNCLSASKYLNTMRFINEKIPHRVAKDLNRKKPKFILKGGLQKEYDPIDNLIDKKYEKIKYLKMPPVYVFKKK
jgi:4-amino-4-deoxy-L-arabinose transferase-like glycosyltransferase